MNKEEILNKLKNLELDINEYCVISGAALVLYEILDTTSDIDMTCTNKYYNSIIWPEKEGAFGKMIKYNDIFEISDNLYKKNRFNIINGYRVSLLEDILETKLMLNRSKDKEIINKLESIIKE